jgi:ribosome-associated protein
MTESAATDQFTSPSGNKTIDSAELIDTITEALLEKKAKDITVLDVRGLTTLTDYFIVCHGTSDTQIGAMANSVSQKTKETLGEREWRKEGLEARRWIILDYVNVVVHIFSEEKREFYGIERMWSDAEITNIEDPEIENS